MHGVVYRLGHLRVVHAENHARVLDDAVLAEGAGHAGAEADVAVAGGVDEIAGPDDLTPIFVLDNDRLELAVFDDHVAEQGVEKKLYAAFHQQIVRDLLPDEGIMDDDARVAKRKGLAHRAA